MPRIPITNITEGGTVRDVEPWALPPEAFNRVDNMRFNNGALVSVGGYAAVFDPPTVDPIWLMPVRTPLDYFWVYASLAKVYCVDAANTHTNITRTIGGDYAATLDIGWTGGVLNTIPVLNNGVDVPQMWDPALAATALAPLTAWPAGYTARALRPFKNYLVALDITKSGTRYPQLVLWSHVAAPGDVPSSWDVTDPTVDAGELPLAETSGFVIDCLPLRNFNVIYKDDQAWLMQFVGGVSVFRFDRVRATTGILGRRCAGAFELEGRGEHHFVVGPDDVYVHNGQYAQSVIDQRNRDLLFGELNTSQIGQVHVTINTRRNEAYVLYPSAGNTYCNRCAVWNWKMDKWTFRDVPSVSFSASGIISPSTAPTTWSADTETWDSDFSRWDESPYSSVVPGVLLGVPGAARKLYKLDEGGTAAGSSLVARAERTGLAIAGVDRANRPIVDTNVRKLVTEIWPRIAAATGTQIDIYVGKQDNLREPVSYFGPYSFTVGVDNFVTPLVEGRYLAIRFEASCASRWDLHGYDVQLEVTGEY